MAGITRDLDDHVSAHSRKYNFDFEHEKPQVSSRDIRADYHWTHISQVSNSEAQGKKPPMQVTYERKSTAATLHSF